jgi:8-oxo-dGTP pyrophosphatase MutT (NUDIX family)
MHSASMPAGDSGFSTRRSQAHAYPWPARSVESPRVRKRRCEQVAAICYRIRSTGIEFLLVNTRSGRWTFPKGGVESDLTLAQTAALEAYEEAGVHGRIEEVSFARYHRHRRGTKETATSRVVVHAYLCEVLRLGPPQESNRNRTWFFPEKAKACLRQDRSPENGAELARVVDRAVARIQRLRTRNTAQADALRRVQFEASEETSVNRSNQASLFNYIRRGGRVAMRDSAALKFAVSAYLREALRLKPAQNNAVDDPPRLMERKRLAGALSSNQVIEIDQPWKTIRRAKSSPRAGKKSQRIPK